MVGHYPRDGVDEGGCNPCIQLGRESVLSMHWHGRRRVLSMHWPGLEYGSALCISAFLLLICTGLYSNQSYPRIDQDENGWILSMRWRGRGWVFFMHWPGREYASALCITPFVWGSEMTWF